MLKGPLPSLVVMLLVAGGCAHRPLEPAAETPSADFSKHREAVRLAGMVRAPERLQPRP